MASMSPYDRAVDTVEASPSQNATSPRQASTPKQVSFELMFTGAHARARLPMRVQIYPHDTTESIVTTVKNFYGLYTGPSGAKGVSFEDKEGNTLIARYENFYHNMTIYVRVFEEFPAEQSVNATTPFQGPAVLANGYHHGEGPAAFHAHRPSHDFGRPASRVSRQRSRSPGSSKSQRDGSVGSAGQKRRSRSAKQPTALGQADTYSESVGGYSSDDGAAHSTTSARTKEQLGNTDISVENIVEGGRRKRAKFDSSELPLFAPPQMPAATSNPSVSPARRMESYRPSLPSVHAGQNPFTNPRPMQASQAYNNMQHNNMYAPQSAEGRRARNTSISMTGHGILPTPDPTVGSTVSEEDKDVALQLMRLGDMSNISHGRTSGSTLDDMFSGRADAPSSTGATSDSESDSDGDLPPARRQKVEANGYVKPSIYQTTESRFVPPPIVDDHKPRPNGAKPKSSSATKPKSKLPKAPRPATQAVVKDLPLSTGGPMSPNSTASSRKPSIASINGPAQPGDDDHPDLSSKPRCQRCRKSKKGCDRQRPCGRCRDAGLSAEQCISEDEGNGRKGRYGRHMGVPIKKDEAEALATMTQPTLLPAAPIALPPMIASADKTKKRKR
ncbi:putative C6 finger domain protein [Emericellopsis atlantica]|uniref:C6 finger domain protein n=1 Tax=Emericellopsis atlantica TaxID=2614577 RepID=A0A9P7ZNI9_9HYPO|nr:putative C6 finger domain protein [Emericellopsis atlantica]KAG9255295.1 putative C6 finger domain protein [Emericellopsis atlantica]